MATRWLHAVSGGAPTYYVEDDAVYSKDGKAVFYISHGWLYSYEGAKPYYWTDGNYLDEEPDGKPVFYFSD